jgi:outer membrane biosynthesis protein TonB
MKAIAHKEENRTTAALISIVLHAIILALLLFVTTKVEKPLMETPPIELNWGGGGDNAALGSPDAGQNDKSAGAGQPAEQPKTETPVEKTAPQKTPPPPAKSKPAVTSPRKVATAQDPNAAALRDAARAQEQRRKTEDAARRQQAAEQQRLAQEAAERTRREADERNTKKNNFGGAFGAETGGGAGNGGKPGNGGQPDGTGDNPFGKSAGDGGGRGGGSGTGDGVSIGGGLAGRKVLSRPEMADNSQKTGVIILAVCVDSDGNVIEADYTQRGSSTTDGELRSKAIRWARQHRFAPSAREKECGTFAFSFKVQ